MDSLKAMFWRVIRDPKAPFIEKVLIVSLIYLPLIPVAVIALVFGIPKLAAWMVKTFDLK